MRIHFAQRAHILSYHSITFIQQPALSEQSLVTIYEEGVVILLHMLPGYKGVLTFFSDCLKIVNCVENILSTSSVSSFVSKMMFTWISS